MAFSHATETIFFGKMEWKLEKTTGMAGLLGKTME